MKTFILSSCLQTHEKTNTGEKPQVGKQFGKSFTHYSALYTHQEITVERSLAYGSNEEIFSLLTSFFKMEKLTWDFTAC
jgi:hypothetical protein